MCENTIYVYKYLYEYESRQLIDFEYICFILFVMFPSLGVGWSFIGQRKTWK